MNLQGYYPSVESVGAVPIYAPKWPYFYKEIERDMERFHDSPSFRKIKTLYFKDKQSPYSGECVQIALHIRRPNVCDVRVEGTDTPDSYYLHCMSILQAKYLSEKKQCLFHIFSQGSPTLFESYKQFPVVFHLDEDVFDTFNSLVFADVLVLSKSSFSYVAALLSDAVVVYTPFWHPPRKHWFLLGN